MSGSVPTNHFRWARKIVAAMPVKLGGGEYTQHVLQQYWVDAIVAYPNSILVPNEGGDWRDVPTVVLPRD
jgi:hypothetical protein